MNFLNESVFIREENISKEFEIVLNCLKKSSGFPLIESLAFQRCYPIL